MTLQELIDFMHRHNLTPEQFAKVLGVTKPAVDHWLTQRRKVPSSAAKVCRLLDKYPVLVGEMASV